MSDSNLPRIATELAKEYAPDLVPEEEQPEEEGSWLDDLLWEEPNTLTPGLYYNDQTVYMTFPFNRNAYKTVGRGKDAVKMPTIERTTICVTSNRDVFPFEEQEVLKRGFLWSETFIQGADESPWRRQDIKTFIDGKAEKPDPWDLFWRIREIYTTYVEYPEDRHYDIMALYVMMTYVFRLFEAVGYIHFHGTAAAGKSQNMAILRALAFNPIWQSSTTASSVFRTFASNIGTMLFDEAERWDSDSAKELMSIIKAGYQEGSVVQRTERNSQDKFIPYRYPAYSPKVFSSIAPQDYVLQSRCLIINMRPALRVLPEFKWRAEEWAELRNQLYLWAMFYTQDLEKLVVQWNTEKRMVKAKDIQNRQWQIAQPLLVIADFIGGDQLVDPLVEWLVQYWQTTIRNQNVVDRMALLLRCLPRVMANNNYIDDHYYPVKIIHDTVTDYMDDDVKDDYKSRSVLRHLQTLGFTEKRNSRQGVQVQLIEENVRKALNQRHIDPFDEDKAWLTGDTEYQRPPTPGPKNLWDIEENTEDEKGGHPWLANG